MQQQQQQQTGKEASGLPPLSQAMGRAPFSHQPHPAAQFQQGVTTATNNATAAGAQHTQVVDNRPLNVRDALTYLDQVKLQFSDQPDVYNRFLDIMKDFKSQAIDTPGVIERVSSLFRQYPALIIGFNTFLPPGYKIEIVHDINGQATYSVTTPETTFHYQQQSSYPVPSQPSQQQPPPPQQQQLSQQQNQSQQSSQQPQQSQQQQSQQLQHAQQKKPVEFNHAINYVNKIKQRFADQPDIYKTFLEILRTYQSDSRPIQEVYAQVQQLFLNAPDLLDEFKMFLPDTSAQSRPASANQNALLAQQRQPPMGQRRGTTPSAITSNQHNAPKFPPPKKRPLSSQLPFSKKTRYDARARLAQYHYNTTEEFDFFERVKKALGNKTTYTEFLKVLNLFNQDIIDVAMLVEKVEPFLAGLGNGELFDWFKGYVRYNERDEILDVSSVVPQPKELNDAKRSGASYRLLPPDYVQPPCSGRDALCYETLNDQWICHPTWASEDGGFVAHKKNQFEEAMYRCEEERYEFDLWIERNKSVIVRLEALAKKMNEMSPEEQKMFKLPGNQLSGTGGDDELYQGGFGDGMSKVIYRQVIEKIYDGDRAREVIDSLHEYPSVTIPIVLKRLKQKDEEWRRSQREWNKAWREIDGKNFYKSLDHQGITFKTVDKKVLSSKNLIAEIEAVYRERHLQQRDAMPIGQKLAGAEANDSSTAAASGKFHLQFSFSDRSILNNVKRLTMAYLEKGSQLSAGDLDRVQRFLSKVLKEFMSSKKHGKLTVVPSADAAAVPGSGEGEEGSGEAVPEKKQENGDMDVDGVAAAPAEHASTFLDKLNGTSAANGEHQTIKVAAQALDRRSMYANTQYYLFFRYLQLAYSRLLKVRETAKSISTVAVGFSKLGKQKVAESLDLLTKREGVPVDVEDGDVYKAMLSLIEKVFEGYVDLAVFEEQARFWFGTSAYVIYTVDKLFHSLCKQLVQIVTESRCIKLWTLYEMEQAAKEQGAQTSIKDGTYRQKADEAVEEDEHLFRIEFNLGLEMVTMELLGDEEQSEPGQQGDSEAKWSDYIDNYVKLSTTDPTIQPKTPVFLKRCMRKLPQSVPVFVINKLECKICVNTYKMFFVEHSEDSLWYKVPSASTTTNGNHQNASMGTADKFVKWMDAKTFSTDAAQKKDAAMRLQKFFVESASLPGSSSTAGVLSGGSVSSGKVKFETRKDQQLQKYVTTVISG